MWLYIEAKIANTEASLKYNIVCLCVLYARDTPPPERWPTFSNESDQASERVVRREQLVVEMLGRLCLYLVWDIIGMS